MLQIDSLNSSQKEAVYREDGSLLILAGAGSGKTKTITTRLARLISEVGVDPLSTLTLTFTNRAAKEMQSRALAMVKDATEATPMLCTFHKFGLLFLKRYINLLDRDSSFMILDSDDKRKVIKSFEKNLPYQFIASEISKLKNSLIEPDIAISKAKMREYKIVANVYRLYQNYLNEHNLVDFDDLLTLTFKILDTFEDVAFRVSQKYRYITVDEYQDTNEIQNRLLKLLCKTHNNICVVGDDDQSIYGFRGAKVENILNFPKEFKDTHIIKLESNYRSTPEILESANELIRHNLNRYQKRLTPTKKSQKEEVKLLNSKDEKLESIEIVKEISSLIQRGVNPDEIAVLFRINALSRQLEEQLAKSNLNYKILAGVKFYEREEIKDLISYLRVISNSSDDFSIKRVINRPKRGVGSATLTKIEANIDDEESIFSYIDRVSIDKLREVVGKKSAVNLKEFVESINILRDTAKDDIENFIDKFEELIDLKSLYRYSNSFEDKISNIYEFYGIFREYMQSSNSIDEFLNEIILDSSESEAQDRGAISLMSIHSSKGLEFEYIFVIGLEEGFFPISIEGVDIEEERRLCYVAITRAKSGLTLSSCESRFHKGKRKNLTKSRFLKESGLVRGSLKLIKSAKFKKGDLVKHKVFGFGRVLEVTKSAKEFKLKINFGDSEREILSSFVERI